jgi:hypothetical protein
LNRVFTEMLPQRMVGTRLVLGLDTSSILRPEAHTSKDRTLVYRANLPADATPVGPGWSFSALVVLPDPVSSWTYILDHRRVPSTETATTIGVAQLQAVLPKVPPGGQRSVLLLDRRYSNAPWVTASASLPTDQLIRARADQVLYRPAPAPTGKRGAPRKDGARFQGSAVTTHGPPDAEWTDVDAQAQTVQVSCWAGLHGRKARSVTLTAVRIIRTGARHQARPARSVLVVGWATASTGGTGRTVSATVWPGTRLSLRQTRFAVGRAARADAGADGTLDGSGRHRA